MTVATTASSVTWQGDDLTTSFPFQFKVPGSTSSDPTNFTVTIRDSDGVETELSSSEFTVTGVSTLAVPSAAGAVSYPLSGAPLTTGSSITIERTLPYTQTVGIGNQSNFYPLAVEAAVDNAVMLVQQVQNQQSRAIVFPLQDNVLPIALPIAAERAGLALIFDADGQVAVGAVTGTTINAILIPFVESVTLLAARAALGATATGEALFTAASGGVAAALIGAVGVTASNQFTAWNNFAGTTSFGATTSMVSSSLNFASELSITASATTNIGGAKSNNLRLTSFATITAFDNVGAGITRHIRMGGTSTLTHNAATLILPNNGSDIVCAVGDCFEAESLGAGAWVVRNFQRANGSALQTGAATASIYASLTTITSSTGAFAVPAGAQKAGVMIICVGGGAGGGGGTDDGAGGGGGAGNAASLIADLTGITTAVVTIGAGGAGGASGFSGNPGVAGSSGGTTSFGGLLAVVGGHGGTGAVPSSAPGSPGTFEGVGRITTSLTGLISVWVMTEGSGAIPGPSPFGGAPAAGAGAANSGGGGRGGAAGAVGGAGSNGGSGIVILRY